MRLIIGIPNLVQYNREDLLEEKKSWFLPHEVRESKSWVKMPKEYITKKGTRVVRARRHGPWFLGCTTSEKSSARPLKVLISVDFSSAPHNKSSLLCTIDEGLIVAPLFSGASLEMID